MRTLVKAVGCLFFLFVAYIIYSADGGVANYFIDTARSTPYGDKVGHVFLFGLLAFFACVVSDYRVITLRKIRVPLGSVIVSVFVILEEFSQAFFPSRTLDIVDLAADCVGIAGASLLAMYLSRNGREGSKARNTEPVRQQS
jgi:polysaccharide biosynthesis protein VpsQ